MSLLGTTNTKRVDQFFGSLRIHILNTFCKKKWSELVIPALNSGQNNLHPAIWGCHHQLDDHQRNSNVNNRDHLVGQLTNIEPETSASVQKAN